MVTGLKMLLAALVLCCSHTAAADSLPDPTRPSIDLNSSGAGGNAGAVQVESAPRGLQSIIISPKYRAAIINGETVALGGRSGDSTLVEVRENSVVLQNSRGRHVLELFPQVSIKKNEAVRQESSVQEKATGQADLPEQAAGGTK